MDNICPTYKPIVYTLVISFEIYIFLLIKNLILRNLVNNDIVILNTKLLKDNFTSKV